MFYHNYFISNIKFWYASNPYDVNRDGEVTSADYIEIKNYIMEVQNEN